MFLYIYGGYNFSPKTLWDKINISTQKIEADTIVVRFEHRWREWCGVIRIFEHKNYYVITYMPLLGYLHIEMKVNTCLRNTLQYSRVYY